MKKLNYLAIGISATLFIGCGGASINDKVGLSKQNLNTIIKNKYEAIKNKEKFYITNTGVKSNVTNRKRKPNTYELRYLGKYCSAKGGIFMKSDYIFANNIIKNSLEKEQRRDYRSKDIESYACFNNNKEIKFGVNLYISFMKYKTMGGTWYKYWGGNQIITTDKNILKKYLYFKAEGFNVDKNKPLSIQEERKIRELKQFIAEKQGQIKGYQNTRKNITY